MTGEADDRRRHLEVLLRNLTAGECDTCKVWTSHLWPDEHPAQWCERHPCPFRSGPPTSHAKLVGCWSRSGP